MRLPRPGRWLSAARLMTARRFIEDAPDTYYITDYYRPYPLVLVRLSVVGVDALRELLAVSWRMGAKKARRSGRSSEQGSHARIRRPTST